MKLLLLVLGCAMAVAIAASETRCTKRSMNNNNTISHPPSLADTGSLTYLALGDSYTIGERVQANERFPYLTVSLLRQQDIAIQYPQYIATTGWTTANLLSAINSQLLLGTFDMVTLLIGVNDQYQRLDTAGYRTRFTALLNKAVLLTGNRTKRVFVLSIPDYSATPFVSIADKLRVSSEINQFNAINKQITLQHNITYIDITPLTREAANDPSLLTNDGLHYSATEHQKWAQLLAYEIKKILQ